MNRFIKLFTFLLLLCLVMTSCESEYSRVVKKELKSGVIHEDLIFGLKIGQTQKDFYDRCWELNKQEKVSQGPGNKFARHYMVLDSTDQESEKVDMLFYGIFDNQNVMHGMHMKFSYLKWAPWNKDFAVEVLLRKLKEKYLKEYPGNDFIEIKIEDDQKALVKVDGNRQILMYPLTAKDVTVKIQDLRQTTSQ